MAFTSNKQCFTRYFIWRTIDHFPWKLLYFNTIGILSSQGESTHVNSIDKNLLDQYSSYNFIFNSYKCLSISNWETTGWNLFWCSLTQSDLLPNMPGAIKLKNVGKIFVNVKRLAISRRILISITHVTFVLYVLYPNVKQ